MTAGPAVLLLPVGVVIERRRATSTWADAVWRPLAVLAGLPEAVPGTLLASEPHQEQAIGRMASFARPLLEHTSRERGGLLATSAGEDEKPRLRAFRAVPARPLRGKALAGCTL